MVHQNHESGTAMMATFCVLQLALENVWQHKDNFNATTIPQNDKWLWLLNDPTVVGYYTVNINAHPQSTVLFYSRLLLLIWLQEIKVLPTSSPTYQSLIC